MTLPSTRPDNARAAAVALALALGLAPATGTAADALVGDWQTAHAARTRLVAAGGGGAPLVAAVEIELADGWKTYWRFPGDAGGVPPNFDWTGSGNSKPSVLYPAPRRMTDRSGDTVGYKGTVLLPVTLAVADGSKPVALRLKLEYGICKEICVPAEASLALDVPAGFAAPVPAALAGALARVPGPASTATPAIVAHQASFAGDTPSITFQARYPGAGGHADAFAETSDGVVVVGLPKKAGPARDGVQTFVIDLTPAEVTDLKGKTLTVTLVSDEGQSETRIALP